MINSTLRRHSDIAVLTATMALLVIGLMLSSMPISSAVGDVKRVGQGVTGLSFMACMATMIHINGRTAGRELAERVPMHVFRMASALGMFAGGMLVLHALR